MDKPTSSTAHDNSRNRVNSLSLMDLQSLLHHWGCSNKKCEGVRRNMGGFRGDEEGIPYVLPCGHYLCGHCKKNLGAKDFPYKCDISGIDCGKTFSNTEMEVLPIALHILAFVDKFQLTGVECLNCTNNASRLIPSNHSTVAQQKKDHRQLGSSRPFNQADVAEKKKHFRFPIELMLCCGHKDCTNIEITKKRKEENRSETGIVIGDPYDAAKDPTNVAATPICVFC
ncbi:hypothetical protein PFISCL1PPCAC_15910, partial [Pristionchus fissidentatus]